ncbi:MAG TPA: hypothetical protein VFA65_19860, partial [Bryobacteraceae bacterium]|nr:hypothetical protein [Bryobacteraceae bacterium]
MTRALAFVVVSVVLSFTWPVMAGDRLEDVLVTNYDYTNAIWTKGTLWAAAPGTEAAVAIDFALRDDKLIVFKARSSHWLVNLSKKVGELTSAFPTTAQILVYRLDTRNEPNGVVISLPFVPSSGGCHSRDFRIEDRKVVE